MKLFVNGDAYTVTTAPRQTTDTWKIRINPSDVSSIHFPIDGMVILKANGGFIMATVKASDYPYHFMDGNYLTLTKIAPPEPEPEPEPEPTDESDANEILDALLGVTE